MRRDRDGHDTIQANPCVDEGGNGQNGGGMTWGIECQQKREKKRRKSWLRRSSMHSVMTAVREIKVTTEEEGKKKRSSDRGPHYRREREKKRGKVSWAGGKRENRPGEGDSAQKGNPKF